MIKINPIEDYRTIIGDEVLHTIHKKARPVYGKKVVHVNATYVGGGVAEILNALVPLMNDVGVDAGWRIVHGSPDFFNVTKSFHNGLQGQEIELTDEIKELFTGTNSNFSKITHFHHDCVIIHDPQPLPLIKFYRKRQPWVWRCHIDLSSPHEELWDFLQGYILKYDRVILSHEKYRHKKLPVDYKIIHPAIDPLSDKNMIMLEKEMKAILRENDVPLDKPIMCQISRFDKWKDPEGVLEVYKLVKKEVDCRLILCGNMAADDPEGWQIFEDIQEKAKSLMDSGDVILLTRDSMKLVSALQQASAVVLQKSTREGFGLTVTEALWKGTPVIGSNTGGIPLQIIDGKTGYLVDPLDYEGCAKKVVDVLSNPEKAKKLADAGKEHVRKNFLITRLLTDYLELADEMINGFKK
ncbi:MAG TPA: glycosyltransferase [Firmicutes bacterium]|nr:glycosyltransferase [Bacillota bacterium]